VFEFYLQSTLAFGL